MPPEKEHRRHMLHALLKVALPAVEAMPLEERADAFEGIAIACDRDDKTMALSAQAAAESIRDAQGAQMTFRQLLA